MEEEKRLQDKMVEALQDAQNDEVILGPESWNAKLQWDALESTGYMKSMKNEWKGLPREENEGGSKSYPNKFSIIPLTSTSKNWP